MIVVDASALVDALVGSAAATERLAGAELAAPHLLDAEVVNVLRRKVRTGGLDASQAEAAIADLIELEISRYGHLGLLPRAWELREDVTTYDALYVALAETLDVSLVTLDGKLAGSPGIRAPVEVLPAR